MGGGHDGVEGGAQSLEDTTTCCFSGRPLSRFRLVDNFGSD